jgi:hypothetical protein
MPADAVNRMNLVHSKPVSDWVSTYYGDLPDEIRDRYETRTRFSVPFVDCRDARRKDPAFRDRGGRLSTGRSDSGMVHEFVAIARHRGWPAVAVRGQTAFRRELWITARAAGLEVRGYRPTEQDRQEFAVRAERHALWSRAPRREPDASPPRQDLAAAGHRSRLKIVEAVVRDRIVEPALQARIGAAARGRIADWLERSARFAPSRPRAQADRPRGERNR